MGRAKDKLSQDIPQVMGRASWDVGRLSRIREGFRWRMLLKSIPHASPQNVVFIYRLYGSNPELYCYSHQKDTHTHKIKQDEELSHTPHRHNVE